MLFVMQFNTIYDDTDCQSLMYVVVFPYTPVSSTNKTFRHDTTQIFIMTKEDLKSCIYLRKQLQWNISEIIFCIFPMFVLLVFLFL